MGRVKRRSNANHLPRTNHHLERFRGHNLNRYKRRLTLGRRTLALTLGQLAPPTVKRWLTQRLTPTKLAPRQPRPLPLTQPPSPQPLQRQIAPLPRHDETPLKRKSPIVPHHATRVLTGRLLKC